MWCNWEQGKPPLFFFCHLKKIINGLWVPRSGSGVLLKLIGNYVFYIDRNLLVLCVFWMMFVQLCMLLVKELMQLFLRYLGHMYNKLCSILILVTLTSVCVLSILFSVHILKCWKGEFFVTLKSNFWLVIISVILFTFVMHGWFCREKLDTSHC